MGSGGLDHRVLAGDVVGGEREVESLARGADDVEVRQRRLDHQHVGAFGDVELAFAQCLAHIRGIHLVAAPVAERRRRVGSLPERPVERGCVLRGVRDNRRVRQRLADGSDAAVHHVAGRNDVGAGLDVRDRGARKEVERLVVVDLVAVEDPAVSVRRVLAEAHVGDQDDLGEARTQCAQRTLDDSVLLVGAGRDVVLFLRDAEEDHRLDPEPDELANLAHE